jgi:hypothetical protein
MKNTAPIRSRTSLAALPPTRARAEFPAKPAPAADRSSASSYSGTPAPGQKIFLAKRTQQLIENTEPTKIAASFPDPGERHCRNIFFAKRTQQLIENIEKLKIRASFDDPRQRHCRRQMFMPHRAVTCALAAPAQIHTVLLTRKIQ